MVVLDCALEQEGNVSVKCLKMPPWLNKLCIPTSVLSSDGWMHHRCIQPSVVHPAMFVSVILLTEYYN